MDDNCSISSVLLHMLLIYILKTFGEVGTTIYDLSFPFHSILGSKDLGIPEVLLD